jgi:hypothetical protein
MQKREYAKKKEKTFCQLWHKLYVLLQETYSIRRKRAHQNTLHQAQPEGRTKSFAGRLLITARKNFITPLPAHKK